MESATKSPPCHGAQESTKIQPDLHTHVDPPTHEDLVRAVGNPPPEAAGHTSVWAVGWFAPGAPPARLRELTSEEGTVEVVLAPGAVVRSGAGLEQADDDMVVGVSHLRVVRQADGRVGMGVKRRDREDMSWLVLGDDAAQKLLAAMTQP